MRTRQQQVHFWVHSLIPLTKLNPRTKITSTFARRFPLQKIARARESMGTAVIPYGPTAPCPKSRVCEESWAMPSLFCPVELALNG
jgi:hypothetical protein